MPYKLFFMLPAAILPYSSISLSAAAEEEEKLSPLMQAAYEGDVETVAALLAAKANPNERIDTTHPRKRFHGWAALTFATQSWQEPVEKINTLLDASADASFQDADGKTALHHAIEDTEYTEDCSIVKALLRAPQSIHCKDYSGKTVLDHARDFGLPELNELLKPFSPKKPEMIFKPVPIEPSPANALISRRYQPLRILR